MKGINFILALLSNKAMYNFTHIFPEQIVVRNKKKLANYKIY